MKTELIEFIQDQDHDFVCTTLSIKVTRPASTLDLSEFARARHKSGCVIGE